jgi:hypothetical protein
MFSLLIKSIRTVGSRLDPPNNNAGWLFKSFFPKMTLNTVNHGNLGLNIVLI